MITMTVSKTTVETAIAILSRERMVVCARIDAGEFDNRPAILDYAIAKLNELDHALDELECVKF
jgi:hypothetical protein